MDNEIISIFKHKFCFGLGQFNRNGKVITSNQGALLKMELDCCNDLYEIKSKNRYKKVGNGLYLPIKLNTGKKYSICVKGRASGNKTKVKLDIFNCKWVRVNDIASNTPIKVSPSIRTSKLDFNLASSNNNNEKKLYFVIISFCKCSKCEDLCYNSNKHILRTAYLESIEILELVEDIVDDIVDDEEIETNCNCNCVLNLTVPNSSEKIINDLDIESAYIKEYVKVNLTKTNNGETETETCHLPLYKLN